MIGERIDADRVRGAELEDETGRAAADFEHPFLVGDRAVPAQPVAHRLRA